MRPCNSKWESDAIKDAVFLQGKVEDILAHKTVEVTVDNKKYKARFGDNGMLLIEEGEG